MTLDQLRERCRASGAVEDEIRYLYAALEAGWLSERRVRLAGALGSAAARAVAEPLRPALERAADLDVLTLEEISIEEMLALLFACVARTREAWDMAAQGDARPLIAFQALAGWRGLGAARLREVGNAAGDARQALDDPAFTDDVDPPRARAMWWASAVESAGHTLALLREGDEGGAREATATVCDFAARAARDEREEIGWRLGKMRRLLLGL